MFTKNPFNKKDEVADLIGNILESDYKVKKEELKGNQHKIDMNKNNKIDAHDFKLLRSKGASQKDEEIDPNNKIAKLHHPDRDDLDEEVELDEEPSHQARTTMKHIKNPTPGEKKAAKDIKPGIAGYRDRVAMLRSAEAGGRLTKEEIELEQINELKKSTIKSYANKKQAELDDVPPYPFKKPGTSRAEHEKAAKGLMGAMARISGKKPTSEEVEQIDERELTKGETKEKERIVKGMKKSLSGFKQRYGDRAKSVMYATATKAAKKD